MNDSFLASWFFGLCLLVTGALAGCSSTAGHRVDTTVGNVDSTIVTSREPIFSVFLIGDAGYAKNKPRSPILRDLEKELEKSGEQSVVIFLGDNIYPDGLPPVKSRNRNRAEKRLLAQLNTVKNYEGRVIFIPGNHDWKSSGKQGLNWVRRQERFVESYLNRGNTFLPDSGYPGPVKVPFDGDSPSDDGPFRLDLILLDTQWWLHPHEKPLQNGVIGIEEQKQKMTADLRKMIDESGDREVIVAAHHPLISYGRHGGRFPFYSHLLPPVFGSIYVAYRKIWGYKQDVSGYPDLKDSLINSFASKDQLIYASGHEHSLQFIPYTNGTHNQYQLVSGSASKPSYVKECSGECITHRGEGFIAIRYFGNGVSKIEFWNQQGNIIKEKSIERALPVETSNR